MTGFRKFLILWQKTHGRGCITAQHILIHTCFLYRWYTHFVAHYFLKSRESIVLSLHHTYTCLLCFLSTSLFTFFLIGTHSFPLSIFLSLTQTHNLSLPPMPLSLSLSLTISSPYYCSSHTQSALANKSLTNPPIHPQLIPIVCYINIYPRRSLSSKV